MQRANWRKPLKKLAQMLFFTHNYSWHPVQVESGVNENKLTTYLKGIISSSFQLGLGPSATVVLANCPWKTASTKGRTCGCDRSKHECILLTNVGSIKQTNKQIPSRVPIKCLYFILLSMPRISVLHHSLSHAEYFKKKNTRRHYQQQDEGLQ